MEQYKTYHILAPHADDEIIGCYEVLKEGKSKDKIVYFPSLHIREEAEEACLQLDFERRIFDEYTFHQKVVDNSEAFFFPDPTYEWHPDHKKYGNIGMQLWREGHSVFFYVTNMVCPYLREVKQPIMKQSILDLCYPQKASLWKYDHKYFLFEGQTKYIML
jgi:hypothetical protein